MLKLLSKGLTRQTALLCPNLSLLFLPLPSNSGIPETRKSGFETMSSVAVLTPESFAEHRSGLRDEETQGKTSGQTPLEFSEAPAFKTCEVCLWEANLEQVVSRELLKVHLLQLCLFH